MELLKLKANPSHPTFKKLERLIGLLENIQIDLEFREGTLKVRDHQFGVTFDMVDADDGNPMGDLPPLFQYKLTRDKVPNQHCECRHCDPNHGKDD